VAGDAARRRAHVVHDHDPLDDHGASADRREASRNREARRRDERSTQLARSRCLCDGKGERAARRAHGRRNNTRSSGAAPCAMTMDASPKTPKRGSRRWSLLSLTPLRSSLKHAPISPVEEAAATPEPAPVAAAAAALPPVVLEESASEGEDDALDSFVRGLRTSTTCWDWDSPRPSGPRGPVASLAPESKRVLANVVALVWQRRTLADLHGGCCGGRLAAAERLLPDMDLPGLNFDPPRQQCGDGCIVGCVEELLETAHGVSKRFELACVAALHVVDLDPSRFEMRVKSAERASEKAEFDYGAKSPGPGCSWVFDALAGRVSVDDEGALLRVLAAVAATPGVAVVGLKNRFRSPTFLGYRDVLALLRFEHGAGSFVCELGLHLRPLLDFDRRHGCRDLYAEFEPLLRGKAPAAAAATVGALRRLGADVLANAMAENELEAIVESVRAGDDAALIGVVADCVEINRWFGGSPRRRRRASSATPRTRTARTWTTTTSAGAGGRRAR